MSLVVTHLQHHAGKIGGIPESGDGMIDQKLFRGQAQVLLQADDVIGVKEHVCIAAAAGETGNGIVAGKSKGIAAQKGSVAV